MRYPPKKKASATPQHADIRKIPGLNSENEVTRLGALHTANGFFQRARHDKLLWEHEPSVAETIAKIALADPSITARTEAARILLRHNALSITETVRLGRKLAKQTNPELSKLGEELIKNAEQRSDAIDKQSR